MGSPGEYVGQVGGDFQSFFDYNVREKLGYDTDGTEFVNVLAMDPNFFTLDMFSADELLNNGSSVVAYRGYNYYGEQIDVNTATPEDVTNYFNSVDENGNYTRTWGAFRPTYIAGYIMDKFAFDDIIFNV